MFALKSGTITKKNKKKQTSGYLLYVLYQVSKCGSKVGFQDVIEHCQKTTEKHQGLHYLKHLK